MIKTLALLFVVAVPAIAHAADVDAMHHIKAESKIFISPMSGFEVDLAAALVKKHVPLVIVNDKEKADYVIDGSNEDVKPGALKAIFITPKSSEHASISVKEAGTGNLVYAYAVDKGAAVHGPQSAAEACAKHLKENIEGK